VLGLFPNESVEDMYVPKLHKGVAIIEVSDPFVLTEIESDAAIQRFLGERLSDRSIVVQPQAVGEVVRRLQSLGHLPRVCEA
jgi:hypothetical protein